MNDPQSKDQCIVCGGKGTVSGPAGVDAYECPSCAGPFKDYFREKEQQSSKPPTKDLEVAPTVVTPTFYQILKEKGYDMRYFVVNEPLPSKPPTKEPLTLKEIAADPAAALVKLERSLGVEPGTLMKEMEQMTSNPLLDYLRKRGAQLDAIGGIPNVVVSFETQALREIERLRAALLEAIGYIELDSETPDMLARWRTAAGLPDETEGK